MNTQSFFVAIALLLAWASIGHGQASKESESSAIHEGYSETTPQYEVNGRVISNVDVKAQLWNPRGKSKEQIRERAQFLTDAYEVQRTPAQQERAKQAKEKYNDAIVVNGIEIGAFGVVGTERNSLIKGLKRNHEAGVTLVSITAYGFPSDGTIPILDRLRLSRILVEERGMIVATSVEDIRRAKQQHKLAVMFNTQGADYAVNDMTMMAKVKTGGVQVSNFTYNQNNALAGGGTKQDRGVSELGKKWIAECNRVGIVVDVSHSSNQTAIDAARFSKKLVIASHSNVYNLLRMNRNMSDEAIRAVGETGGVVATVGAGTFLNDKLDARPEDFAKHVDYTAKLIGHDKTGFATDYVYATHEYFLGNVSKVDVYPPEQGFGGPTSNLAAEHVWDVVAVLEDEYGWNEQHIRGFLGENLLRVYEANWR